MAVMREGAEHKMTFKMRAIQYGWGLLPLILFVVLLPLFVSDRIYLACERVSSAAREVFYHQIAGDKDPNYLSLQTDNVKLVANREYWNEELSHFVENPKGCVHSFASTLLKGGSEDRKIVYKMQLGEKVFLVKHYKNKTLLHRVKNRLRMNRALIAWNNHVELKKDGLPVPDHVLVLEQKKFGLPVDSYVISEFLEGGDMLTVLKNSESTPSIVRDLQKVLFQLDENLYIHGDMHLGNFMLDAQGKVRVIDVDHLHKHSTRSVFYQKTHEKEMLKIAECLEAFVEEGAA